MLHSCAKCGRKFTRKFNRDVHIKRVHDEGFLPGKTTYTCPFCQEKGVSTSFAKREDLVTHVDELHQSDLVYKLRKTAFNGKVEIFSKVLVSLQPLDQFVHDRQNKREIGRVILQALNKAALVRVALIVTAYYQLSHPFNEEEVSEKKVEGDVGSSLADQRDSFTLRSSSTYFSRYDKPRGFYNRVQQLLQSLLKREEDLLTKGSGWQFESLNRCEIEMVRMGNVD